MIMTKQEYFARSREQGLPNRCPILPRCERHFETIKRANRGEPFVEQFKPKEPEVPISGDGPYTAGGANNFIIGGACPEVALFEPQLFFGGLNHAPTTKGQYDKYTNPQYEVLETGHFSECGEYSFAITAPHPDIQTLAQQEITGQIIQKLDELLVAIKEAKLDEISKKNIEAAIEAAKRTPSPTMFKKAADTIGPLASIVDAGYSLAPHMETLVQLIAKIWPV